MHPSYLSELRALTTGTPGPGQLAPGTTVRVTAPGSYAGVVGQIQRRGRLLDLVDETTAWSSSPMRRKASLVPAGRPPRVEPHAKDHQLRLVRGSVNGDQVHERLASREGLGRFPRDLRLLECRAGSAPVLSSRNISHIASNADVTSTRPPGNFILNSRMTTTGSSGSGVGSYVPCHRCHQAQVCRASGHQLFRSSCSGKGPEPLGATVVGVERHNRGRWAVPGAGPARLTWMASVPHHWIHSATRAGLTDDRGPASAGQAPPSPESPPMRVAPSRVLRDPPPRAPIRSSWMLG